MRFKVIQNMLERYENSNNPNYHRFLMPDRSIRVLSNELCFKGFADATNGNFDSDEARVVFFATASDFGPQMLELLHTVIESKSGKEA